MAGTVDHQLGLLRVHAAYESPDHGSLTGFVVCFTGCMEGRESFPAWLPVCMPYVAWLSEFACCAGLIQVDSGIWYGSVAASNSVHCSNCVMHQRYVHM